MKKNSLFFLDSIFVFYGAFWAGLVFFRALSLEFNFIEWFLVFSVMAVLFYPLIRKAVETLLEIDWKKFKPGFEKDYRNRAKNRWEY